MQLVLCNNRVMAYGENYLQLGGVVVNTETGARHENATIAECDSAPSDIGQVGYEYRAGEFIPCAPYGKGDGTVPVLCGNDCKAIKDSGIPNEFLCLIEKKPYSGTGGKITLDFKYPPVVVFISSGATPTGTIIGNSLVVTSNSSGDVKQNITSVTRSGTSVTWSGTHYEMNQGGGSYVATAICVQGGGVTDV